MIRIALLICLVGLVPTDGLRRRCINSGILFPDKILGSPIVVYGESIGKRVYVDTDTDFLFNVTLRVDCILKGQDVEHQIEITQAGSIESRRTADAHVIGTCFRYQSRSHGLSLARARRLLHRVSREVGHE